MKQSTRIAWCRGGFLALCAAPALLVTLWIASRIFLGDAAAQKEDWERELSGRLGMTVKIGEVNYPQMDLAELKQVELADAETGYPFARMTAIEVTKTADGCLIQFIAPEIETAQLNRFSRILHDRLLCGGQRDSARIEVVAHELTLLDDDAPRTLVDLSAVFEPADSGPQLTASFQWPEATGEEQRIHCTLSRNAEFSPPVTRFSLDTGQANLPCHLAAHFWQPLERLGDEAEFTGEASWLMSSPASAKLSGVLSGVDLNTLVSEQFPQILSGKARIKLEQAAIDGGRLTSAAGKIEVHAGGRISRSLLVAAAKHLGLQNEAGSSGGEVVAYRRLGIGFRIDGAWLRLSGSADAASPGVLITKNTAPILKAPPHHAAAAAGLARVLLPDSQMQVPLASQTAELVQLFPTPTVVPAQAEGLRAASRSHTPTRLSPGSSSTNVIRER